MSRNHQVILSCLACGRTGHSAVTGPALNSYMCPFVGAHHWGDTVAPKANGCCGRCGWGNFRYINGLEFSRDGVRGYRCLGCGAVKPERAKVAS